MRLTGMTLLSLLVLCLGISQITYAASMWEKGRHYKELPVTVKTRDPSKVEVVEVLWYGCPHCYEFNNDYLPGWKKNMPDYVDFWDIPAPFPGWKPHARAFFAAEHLGVKDELHQTLFDTIVANPRQYSDVDDLKPIFLDHGVSEEDYEAVFEASGFRKISKVEESMEKAEARIKKYRITGVPALIVNGRYKIGVRDAGNFANMIKIANFLINQEWERMQAESAE